MRKKYTALLLAVCLFTVALCTTGCDSDAPALAEIYDTAKNLILASAEINDLLFGYGLPVYDVSSSLAAYYRVYDEKAYASYETALPACPYSTVDEIKEKLASVYSADYTESLYTTLFDGFVHNSTVVRAQINESDTGLGQSIDYEPLLSWERIYDYSTMRMIKPSSADYVTLEIDTHLPDDPTVLTVKICLIKEEEGWRLDTPTY